MSKWIMDESGDLINLDRMNCVCADSGGPEDSRFRVRCLGDEWESTLINLSSEEDAIKFIDALQKRLEK
jgi:hypothetical protein